MSEHPNRPPTAKCKGCANCERTRCSVFCDPEYQHKREGGCYGRLDAVVESAKVLYSRGEKNV